MNNESYCVAEPVLIAEVVLPRYIILINKYPVDDIIIQDRACIPLLKVTNGHSAGYCSLRFWSIMMSPDSFYQYL